MDILVAIGLTPGPALSDPEIGNGRLALLIGLFKNCIMNQQKMFTTLKEICCKDAKLWRA